MLISNRLILNYFTYGRKCDFIYILYIYIYIYIYIYVCVCVCVFFSTLMWFYEAYEYFHTYIYR